MNNMLPVGMISGNGPVGRGAGRGGLLRRPVPPGGGQLEVAGLVVSSWGANYGSRSIHPVPPMGSYHPGPRPLHQVCTALFLVLRICSLLSQNRLFYGSVFCPQMFPSGMRSYRMPMNEFNGMVGSRPNQRPSFQTRGPGTKNIIRNKKSQVCTLFIYYRL